MANLKRECNRTQISLRCVLILTQTNALISINHSHEGCHCLPGFEGDNCELLQDQPTSTLAVAEMRAAGLSDEKNPGKKLGITIPILAIALLAGAVMMLRRKKRHNALRERSVENSAERLREFSQRRTRAGGDESDGVEMFEEEDKGSVLDRIEADAKFV